MPTLARSPSLSGSCASIGSAAGVGSHPRNNKTYWREWYQTLWLVSNAWASEMKTETQEEALGVQVEGEGPVVFLVEITIAQRSGAPIGEVVADASEYFAGDVRRNTKPTHHAFHLRRP